MTNTQESTGNTQPQRTRGRDILIGVVAGGIVGAVLTLYFSPRATELKTQVVDSARRFRRTAADRLEQVSVRLGDAKDQVARAAQVVRDDADDDGAGSAGTHAVTR